MSTHLTIPDGILEAAGMTEQDCLIELAVQLYAQRRIKIGHALRLSQLTRREFEQELARHNIAFTPSMTSTMMSRRSKSSGDCVEKATTFRIRRDVRQQVLRLAGEA